VILTHALKSGAGETLKLVPPIVVFSSLTYTQERTPDLSAGIPDSLVRRNTASILFDRNLNTFNWIANAVVDTSAFGNRVRFKGSFASNIILIEATNAAREQRLRSDRFQDTLALSRRLDERVAAQARWSSLIYSDNKAVGLSTASVNTILGGVEYIPSEHLILTPLAGYRWDKQIGFRDRGLSYELSARTNNVNVDGYLIDGSAQFHQDRVNPRLLEQHFLRIGTQKTFLGNTRDSLEIGFTKNRREFYGFASGALESRVENVFSFTNLLDYEFDSRVVASLFVNAYNRSLAKEYRAIASIAAPNGLRNTGIDEFRLDAFVQAKYLDDERGFSLTARLGHSERNERHFLTSSGLPNQSTLEDEERSKDNLARRTALSGTLELPLSKSDHVALSGTASILRYDTPSETNNDDRDELLVELSLATFHTVNRFLEVSLRLDGTLSHLVYLFSERSANNNINRILRFAPRTTFRPFASLTSVNSFEVLANYTVYDFEQTSAQVRSFSYRQFGWSDSTSFDITNRLGLDAFVYLKVYSRGQLNWNDFTERRENSFVDKTYALQARFSPEIGSTIAVGIRYFSQTRYSFEGETRKLDSFLRSFGPTCLLLWRLNAFSELSLKGWYEQRKLEGGGSKSLANMTMNINILL
jgi:hypothetical protein